MKKVRILKMGQYEKIKLYCIIKNLRIKHTLIEKLSHY